MAVVLRPGVRGTRLAIEGAIVACDSASCTDMIGHDKLLVRDSGRTAQFG
jgi:hypothetical protein